jgi:Cysteine synthase
MRYEDIYQMVGKTPHVQVCCSESNGAKIYVKLEGDNPTGSLKDRACLKMIRTRLEDGELNPSKVLLDASSGNMACAIAFYGKMLGFQTTVVVNSKLTTDKRKFLEYYGATVLQVGDLTIEGNKACRKMVQEDKQRRFCFLDQLHNWANPLAYYESIGPEILGDFPDLAMVIGSLGTGGSMSGTARYIKEHKPNTKVVVVQAASGTKMPGTGSFDDGDYITPFIQRGFDEQLFDHVVKIREQDAIRRTIQLRDQGIFCGLQTGGVLHAALAAVQQFHVEGPVVMLSGDAGWKNMDKLLQI